MKFEGKVAVIAGVNSGVGKATAKVLAEGGARLVFVGRNAARLTAIGEELGLENPIWTAVEADVTQEEGAQKVFDATLKKFGRADILLNFVGGWMGGEQVVDAPAEKLETMLRQHVWCLFNLMKVFGAHMQSNGWGRVAVISSPSASEAPAKSAPYATAKAGMEALIKVFANEMAGTGVTANAVRVRIIDEEHAREMNPNAENAGWTTPEEIAAILEFLCTEEGGRINGTILPLHGGAKN